MPVTTRMTEIRRLANLARIDQDRAVGLLGLAQTYADDGATETAIDIAGEAIVRLKQVRDHKATLEGIRS